MSVPWNLFCGFNLQDIGLLKAVQPYFLNASAREVTLSYSTVFSTASRQACQNALPLFRMGILFCLFVWDCFNPIFIFGTDKVLNSEELLGSFCAV